MNTENANSVARGTPLEKKDPFYKLWELLFLFSIVGKQILTR